MARRVLRASLKVADAFSHVRSPGVYGFEYPEVIDGQPFDFLRSTPELRAKANTHVYSNRWKRMSEASTELEVEVREADVMWGPRVRDLLSPLLACRAELAMAIEDWLVVERDGRALDDATRPVRNDAIIYESTTKDSQVFTARIQKTIDALDKCLRPCMGRSKLTRG